MGHRKERGKGHRMGEQLHKASRWPWLMAELAVRLEISLSELFLARMDVQ